MKHSPRILHSSPMEEKKLGFPFSENGPSAIQGEGATSAFSDLREWEERGVTNPNMGVYFKQQDGFSWDLEGGEDNGCKRISKQIP